MPSSPPPLMRSTVFQRFKQSLQFRCQRVWTSLYFGQYTTKWALLALFPGILCGVRYRAETQYGYYVFIHEDDQEEITPGPRVPYLLQPLRARMERYFAWKNGTKFYLKADATVEQLKAAVYARPSAIPTGVLAGCKGRVFNNDDLLTTATRAFCKRDPRIVLFRQKDDAL